MKLNERTVVCDSSRIDTLIAMPLGLDPPDCGHHRRSEGIGPEIGVEGGHPTANEVQDRE